MWWVASQPNPWEIPVWLACKKLQLIWGAIFPGFMHTVTSNSAVYILVSLFWYTHTHTNKLDSQANQRTMDSWRTLIGACSLVDIIAYCKSQRMDTDEAHQEYAVHQLEHLHYLYNAANTGNKKELRGLYQGQFVLQALGAHFTAMDGAQIIQGVDDPDPKLVRPYGALVLACASVSTPISFHLIHN